MDINKMNPPTHLGIDHTGCNIVDDTCISIHATKESVVMLRAEVSDWAANRRDGGYDTRILEEVQYYLTEFIQIL